MADASSPMLSATVSVKTATRGQPNAISAGPPIVSPCPYSVTAPVKIEIIENDMAKLEKPPIERNSSWAYPSAPSSCSSAEDSILVLRIITAQDVIKTGLNALPGFSLTLYRGTPAPRVGQRGASEPRDYDCSF